MALEETASPSNGNSSGPFQHSATTQDAADLAPEVADVLAELYYLLNQYAPMWYTEQHQVRVQQALRALGRL